VLAPFGTIAATECHNRRGLVLRSPARAVDGV